MHITLIAGARPNFMKIAPIIHAIQKGYADTIDFRLVHTGQHNDERMSKTFFEELNIPKPDTNLNCGGGTQAEQTAAIMIAFERELEQHPTDLVLVVGDVTSTMACSIVAKKMRTPVTHVEAGIRSYDLSMPEEINRMVTDSITDYFFTTSRKANENLRKSGVEEERIFFVGNVMIDTLLANRTRFRAPAVWDELGLVKGEYFVMTMHRPANVDEEKKLKIMIEEIVEGARGLPILFPMHPRTQRIFAKLNINYDSLKAIEPLGYLEFNYLVENSKAVLTDSGGITEETTVMGIPCMTIRDNTERPETISEGTNKLVGTDPANIRPALDELFAGEWKTGSIPELWDGKAAERMVEKIAQLPLHVS
jgi:UDP-N-acetylglucosamine 2-epimerase (non-hydrolysing)